MQYLNVKQLAQRYGVHRSTVWRWCKDPGFPQSVKLGRNTARWPLDAVVNWEVSRSKPR